MPAQRNAFRNVSALCSNAFASASDIWLHSLDHAMSSDNARQRQGHPIFCDVAADRDHLSFIAQDHLSDTRRHHADAELARFVAFDNGDVGVTDVALNARLQIFDGHPSLPQRLQNRHALD